MMVVSLTSFLKFIFCEMIAWILERFVFILAYYKTRIYFFYERKLMSFFILFGLFVSFFVLIVYYTDFNDNGCGLCDLLYCLINNTYDFFIEHIGKYLMQILSWQIPFYYFIFREQKNMSDASIGISEWNIKTSVILFGTFVVIKVYYEQLCRYLLEDGLVILKLWLLISLVWFISNVYRILTRTSATNLIDYLIYRFSIYANAMEAWLRFDCLIKYKTVTIVTKYFGNHLVFSITAIYQALVYLSQRDMIGLFDEKYRKWIRNIRFLITEDKDSPNDNITFKFVSNFEDEYFKYYKAALKGHLALLKSLYKNNYVEEGKVVLSELLKMRCVVPNNNESHHTLCKFEDAYMKIMLQVLLFFYKENISLQPVLSSMHQMYPDQESYDRVIVLYRSLIIKATEAQDIKMLIRLSYSLLNVIDKASESKNMFLGSASRELIEIKCYGRILYVFISAMIKSMELGYKEILSFFAKFIVSNFKWKVIQKVMYEASLNNGKDRKYDVHSVGVDIGLNSFNIDEKTCPYCLHKVAILIYGQQAYCSRFKIRVGCGNVGVSAINIWDFAKSNNDYIAYKTFAEGYKLVWMEDKDFKLEYLRLLDNISSEAVNNRGEQPYS